MVPVQARQFHAALRYKRLSSAAGCAKIEERMPESTTLSRRRLSRFHLCGLAGRLGGEPTVVRLDRCAGADRRMTRVGYAPQN